MTHFASWTDLRRAIAEGDVKLPADAPGAPKGLQGASLANNEPSHLEALFLQLWRFLHGPEIESEYAFDAERRWRFDFALLEKQIAIEIEGGLYGGRHTRPAGYAADCEKYNAAVMQGWRVIRLTPAQLTPLYIQVIINWIEK